MNKKRTTLKKIAGTTALLVPNSWTKPIVSSVILPSHAQTSVVFNSTKVEFIQIPHEPNISVSLPMFTPISDQELISVGLEVSVSRFRHQKIFTTTSLLTPKLVRGQLSTETQIDIDSIGSYKLEYDGISSYCASNKSSSTNTVAIPNGLNISTSDRLNIDFNNKLDSFIGSETIDFQIQTSTDFQFLDSTDFQSPVLIFEEETIGGDVRISIIYGFTSSIEPPPTVIIPNTQVDIDVNFETQVCN